MRHEWRSMVAEGPPPVRVLLDTNVVLELLLRQPWLGQAQPMWDARDAGTIIACLPVSALTNIYYIGRRQIGQQRIMDGIRFCIANFELVSLEREDAEFAM